MGVLYSLQRKVVTKAVFGYPERAVDLGTHTSKKAIIPIAIECAPLWKKVFHQTTEWLVHYAIRPNCNRMAFCVIQKKFFVIRVIFWACPDVLEKLYEIRKIRCA